MTDSSDRPFAVSPGASRVLSELDDRPRRWHATLARLGVSLPLELVGDVGALFVRGAIARVRDAIARVRDASPRRAEHESDAPRVASPFAGALAPAGAAGAYRALLAELAESPAAARVRALGATDDVVVACLAHVLGSSNRDSEAAAPSGRDPRARDAAGDKVAPTQNSLIRAFVGARLGVLTRLDALPVDVLEMCVRAGNDSSGAAGLVDLLAALGDARALDVARFSLELLPAATETRSRKGADATRPDGYGGLSRHGSIDAIVPSELAWDDAEFERKMLENELFRYARERASEPMPVAHQLLVDASASMRGERATFARATAVSLAKKLCERREDVSVRFFDARLYEKRRVKLGAVPAAYVASFQGERGRWPARALSELATELGLSGSSGAHETVVHVFTHGGFHVPNAVLAALRERAKLYAVFFASSPDALDPGTLGGVDRHWIVDPRSLQDPSERRRKAEDVLAQGARR